MEEKKMVKIKVSTIILGVLLVVVAFFAGFERFQIVELNKKIESTKVQVANKNENVSNGQTAFESTYSFYILDMLENEKRDFKINDDYTVTFEIIDTETTPVKGFNTVRITTTYNLYVNNKFITKDTLFDDNENDLKVCLWNDYILYEYNGGTDIRSDELFIINKDGNVVKDLRELDENDKGLVLDEIWKYSDKLVVTGTRISHGYAVVSQGNPADGITAKSLKTIPKDTAVSVRYTYKLDANGNIDFDNPSVVKLQTFEQYVRDNKDNIISAIKNDTEYEEGMVENFIKGN